MNQERLRTIKVELLLAVSLLIRLNCTLPGTAVIASTSEVRPDGAIRLTAPITPNSHQNPAFSPDGQTLLFTWFHQGYNAGPAGLYRLDLSEGIPVPLLDEAGHDSVNLPGSSWNITRNLITFSSDRQDTDEIWTIAHDGSSLFRVTHHTSPTYFIEPSFSPDGQWIVFEVDNSGTDHRGGNDHREATEDQQCGSIWKVQANGDDLTQLTDGPANNTDDRQPNWSPQGNRILFQRRNLSSDDWNLYTMAVDGSDIRQVTTDLSADTDASWSPYGKWIVYSSDYGGLPVPNIYVIPATGGTPIRVTNDSIHEDGAPSWSPDGKRIAFESHAGQDENSPSSLWRIDAPVRASLAIYLPLTISNHAGLAAPFSLSQVKYLDHQLQSEHNDQTTGDCFEKEGSQ